jgi:NADH-quinone oxidoreductase subunit C
MQSKTIEVLKEALGADILKELRHRGARTVAVRSAAWLQAARLLKERLGMDAFVDLCAVDYPGRDPRFEVVLHLRSTSSGERLRLKAGCDGADPAIASVSGVWLAADWFEREAFDLFGIRFEGHPNLKRLLCHQGFEGHPLRKDYPKDRLGAIPVPETLMDEMLHVQSLKAKEETRSL